MSNLLKDWIADTVEKTLRRVAEDRFSGKHDGKAPKWHNTGSAFCVSCKSAVVRHVQVVEFLSSENPIGAVLSDSRTKVHARFSEASTKRHLEEHGSNFTSGTRGGIICILDFDLYASSQSKSEESVYLLIKAFRYKGAASRGTLGEPLELSKRSSVKKILETLKDSDTKSPRRSSTSHVFIDEEEEESFRGDGDEEVFIASQRSADKSSSPLSNSMLDPFATQLPPFRSTLSSYTQDVARLGGVNLAAPAEARQDIPTSAAQASAAASDTRAMLALLGVRQTKANEQPVTSGPRPHGTPKGRSSSTSRIEVYEIDDEEIPTSTLPIERPIVATSVLAPHRKRLVFDPHADNAVVQTPPTVNQAEKPSVSSGFRKAAGLDLTRAHEENADSADHSRRQSNSRQPEQHKEHETHTHLPLGGVKPLLSYTSSYLHDGGFHFAKLASKTLEVPLTQKQLLDRPESWQHPEPGLKFPGLNIPRDTLTTLKSIAQRDVRGEVFLQPARNDRTPLESSPPATPVTAWDSSDLDEAATKTRRGHVSHLPPDSSMEEASSHPSPARANLRSSPVSASSIASQIISHTTPAIKSALPASSTINTASNQLSLVSSGHGKVTEHDTTKTTKLKSIGKLSSPYDSIPSSPPIPREPAAHRRPLSQLHHKPSYPVEALRLDYTDPRYEKLVAHPDQTTQSYNKSNSTPSHKGYHQVHTNQQHGSTGVIASVPTSNFPHHVLLKNATAHRGRKSDDHNPSLYEEERDLTQSQSKGSQGHKATGLATSVSTGGPSTSHSPSSRVVVPSTYRDRRHDIVARPLGAAAVGNLADHSFVSRTGTHEHNSPKLDIHTTVRPSGNPILDSKSSPVPFHTLERQRLRDISLKKRQHTEINSSSPVTKRIRLSGPKSTDKSFEDPLAMVKRKRQEFVDSRKDAKQAGLAPALHSDKVQPFEAREHFSADGSRQARSRQMTPIRASKPTNSPRPPERPDRMTSNGEISSSSMAPQFVFAAFSNAYPDYSGDVKHFLGRCHALEKLHAERKLHRSLWDDYVVRHKTDYIPYSLKCNEDGEDPQTYERFYDDEFEEPKHTSKILNLETLKKVLLDGPAPKRLVEPNQAKSGEKKASTSHSSPPVQEQRTLHALPSQGPSRSPFEAHGKIPGDARRSLRDSFRPNYDKPIPEQDVHTGFSGQVTSSRSLPQVVNPSRPPPESFARSTANPRSSSRSLPWVGSSQSQSKPAIPLGPAKHQKKTHAVQAHPITKMDLTTTEDRHRQKSARIARNGQEKADTGRREDTTGPVGGAIVDQGEAFKHADRRSPNWWEEETAFKRFAESYPKMKIFRDALRISNSRINILDWQL